MANLKISQLPVASALTGSELVELVQSGANVQATVSSLGGQIASTVGIVGGGQPAMGSLAANLNWVNIFAYQPNSTVVGVGSLVQTNTGVNTVWIQNGNSSFQTLTPSAATLAASLPMAFTISSSLASNAAWINPVGGYMGLSGIQHMPCIRKLANGVPVAGFTMTYYFSLGVTANVEQIFMGYQGFGSPAVGATNIPSQFLNSIALGRDSTDTNLQFMINNGSGTAQKTDLGVTHTSLANKLLRLVITCDGFGNVTITLSNMEAGGLQYSVSYPTNTAKLPVAQSGTGTNMAPLFYINNGGAAVAVSFGTYYGFLTFGIGV